MIKNLQKYYIQITNIPKVRGSFNKMRYHTFKRVEKEDFITGKIEKKNDSTMF